MRKKLPQIEKENTSKLKGKRDKKSIYHFLGAKVKNK
jgi:hypothetical protein